MIFLPPKLLFLCAAAIFFALLYLFEAPSLALALAAILALLFSNMIAPRKKLDPRLQNVTRTDERIFDQPLLNALADAAIIVSAKGDIVAFNEKAQAMAPQLAANTPLSFSFRNPVISDAILHAAKGEIATSEIRQNVPVDQWTHLTAAPFLSAGKTMICLTLRDETAQKQSERMRADFVANASHELRTPLASISGFIETLRGAAKEDPKARAHFLDIMQSQAERMSRLIDDLLSLSRLEQHLHIAPNESVDLVAILQQVVEGLSILSKESGVAIQFNPEFPALNITGARDELIRAFENLIENAIKYGESGKKVEIFLGHDQATIKITIRDFGEGIAAHHLPRLTERFYRVDESHSREKGGTGLGLALVKHIVNHHKGKMEIASTLGVGTTVTLQLPDNVQKKPL